MITENEGKEIDRKLENERKNCYATCDGKKIARAIFWALHKINLNNLRQQLLGMIIYLGQLFLSSFSRYKMFCINILKEMKINEIKIT